MIDSLNKIKEHIINPVSKTEALYELCKILTIFEKYKDKDEEFIKIFTNLMLDDYSNLLNLFNDVLEYKNVITFYCISNPKEDIEDVQRPIMYMTPNNVQLNDFVQLRPYSRTFKIINEKLVLDNNEKGDTFIVLNMKKDIPSTTLFQSRHETALKNIVIIEVVNVKTNEISLCFKNNVDVI